MHKKFFLCLFSLFLFSGCMTQAAKEEKESLKNYESYIDAVINNKGTESKTIPFDYKLNVAKKSDNTFEYEVIISDPQVAMYEIQAIAVDLNVDSNTNVYPSLGVLGEDYNNAYYMIPYQVNAKRNFISGFVLNAISSQPQFTINVMVMWKDSSLQNSFRVFFNCNYVQEAGDDQNGEKQTSDVGKNNAETVVEQKAAEDE